jgi:lysocardiolipin and lysophospholipid acyltransferase
MQPQEQQPQSRRQWMRGAATVLLLFWSAFCGACVLPLGLPALFTARGMYRRYANFVAGMWLAFAAMVIESPWLGNVSFVFSGDWPADAAERALVISNHRCRLDWMFLWAFFRRLGGGAGSCAGGLPTLKIVLKDTLKHLPAFGWAMQFFLFLFLRRAWERDAAHIASLLGYFRAHGEPLSLLLFPEGTDLSPSNVAKSNAFAAKAGAPAYDYVLHPRTRGFVHCLRELRAGGGAAPPAVDALYDITLGYLDFAKGERPSEASLVRGRLPTAVHVHLTRHDIAVVPAAGADAAHWVEQRFKEKEARLRRFYADEAHPSFGAEQLSAQPPRVLPRAAVALFWFTLMGAFVWGPAVSSVARRAVACMVAVLVLGDKVFDGYDTVELRHHAPSCTTDRKTA